MIKFAEINGNEHILDLGTGAGYVAIGFSKTLEQGKVVGVDKYDKKTPVIGPNFFEELKINFFNNKLGQAKENAILEKQNDTIAFIKSDLTKHFPFSNSSFDLVLSSQFLYCIPHKNLNRVLHEIDRVIKPSGKLIFFESEKFIYWNISKVKSFFENLGYTIHIQSLNVMSNKCIFTAKKPRKK